MTTKLEQLQAELSKFRKERDVIIFEKGLLAEDNKDLRENGAYIAMEEREHYYTAKIHKTIRDIEELTKKPYKEVKKKVKEELKYEFKPHKWL
jgi:transcription elongation GreA/GreB family factor